MTEEMEGDTVLTGRCVDQSALYGVLQPLQALSIPLRSVVPFDGQDGEPTRT